MQHMKPCLVHYYVIVKKNRLFNVAAATVIIIVITFFNYCTNQICSLIRNVIHRPVKLGKPIQQGYNAPAVINSVPGQSDD